ncbi:hypothetical protein [Brevibacillus migulae]|uniref:hypothetical protein n=1 Tax=Brevibacillus migulae TaxID=1644114 RepID=UPI00106EC4F8|nr:hypothetical protein [Brevibacillus migulae]
MVRKTWFVLLVFCLVLTVCPRVPHARDLTSFHNDFYTFRWGEDGHIRVEDRAGNVIVDSVQYVAEYGEIYNALMPSLPAGAKAISLDTAPAFRMGEPVEIRSESYLGRMNMPLVHRAKVVGIQGNTLHFSPATANPMENNLFIKRVNQRISQWQKVAVTTVSREDGLQLNITGHTPVSVVTTQYTFSHDSPTIDVQVETAYQQHAKVFQETMLLRFIPPVTEVYRKNSKLDTASLQKRYWLGHHGVKFGKGSQQAWIYHAPALSSMEVAVAEKQLLLHLEHMNDHHFVQQTSSMKVGKVRHPAEYQPGDTRTNSFSLTVGWQPRLQPRFMNQPYGFLATHIWTEHADEQTLASNRAIYYGSQKWTNPAQATGGFVKYRIPVTKSVFYSNPYFRPQRPLNIGLLQDQQFVRFLDDLHGRGSEIVLHNIYPYDFPPYRQVHDNILQWMKNRYHSKTWIDHGFLKTNFAFQGLETSSPYSMASLWEKHGIRYFWHYSSEDITGIDTALDLLQTQNGDQYWTPLYWSHPTVTGPFYTWSTAIVTDDSLYHYQGKQLDRLVQQRGVFISHAYLSRLFKGTYIRSFLARDRQGQLVINPAFNQVLQRMASLRDQRKLYLSTVAEMMDYWLALSQIRMTYAPDGSVLLHNPSNRMISGLSLAVRSPEVYVNGKKPPQYRSEGELIFWFDLPPHATAILSDRIEKEGAVHPH